MKILITGASSGIGESIAQLCLEKGYHITGVARDFTKCSITSPHFTPIQCDLSSLDQIEEKIRPLLKDPKPYDAAVFCAGQGLFGFLEQLALADIQQLMNTNFLSHVALSKLLLPEMKKRQKGTLIYIGSEAALQGKSQGSLYCASKFALRGFTQALRKECAKSGVRISLINPGMVQTPFFKGLHFQHAEHEDYRCEAREVAQVVIAQLEARAGLVFDEINLSPLKHQIVSKSVENSANADSPAKT